MSEAAIQIESLRFEWEPGTPLLNIQQLLINQGDRSFIHGPSGCGKSTLLGLIAGVIAVQSGRLDILGTSLTSMSQSQRDRFRADHFGVIFQTFNLLPYLSVVENVLLGCAFSDTRQNKAEQQGGTLNDAAAALLIQLGLDGDIRDRPVTTLSVGQQQRVAVARALIGSPAIVIADEPTSALDTAARIRFLELLKSACDAAHSTLLFVSHDMTLADQFDRRIDLPHINEQPSPLTNKALAG